MQWTGLDWRTVCLSCFRRGPKRYNWSAEKEVWFNARDDGLLKDLLEEELGTVAGRTVKLEFGHDA